MAGPKVGNRATSEDAGSYYDDTKPGKPGFVEEVTRRAGRSKEQVRKESLTRVGAGKIGQSAGTSEPKPNSVPKVKPATPSVPNVAKPNPFKPAPLPNPEDWK